MSNAREIRSCSDSRVIGILLSVRCVQISELQCNFPIDVVAGSVARRIVNHKNVTQRRVV